MGKIQKMVWPQGKNLKPQPKGRAPVQPIPGPKPRSAEERRQKAEYRLAISKGLYLSGEVMETLTLLSTLRQEMVSLMGIRPDMLAMPTSNTAPMAGVYGQSPVSAAIASMDCLLATPVPSREPIMVTMDEHQSLMDLPVAETPQELAGTAVMVVTPEILEGEILPPEQETTSTDYDHKVDAMKYMMVAARSHSKRVTETMAMLSMHYAYRKTT